MSRWNDYPDSEFDLSVDNFNGAVRAPSGSLIQNALLNGWVAGLPFYWGRSVAGGTIVEDTTAAQGFSGGSALKWTQTSAHAANQLYQDVFGAAPWRAGLSFNGVSFRARVKTAAASFVRPVIQDSAGAKTYGSYHTGGGAWEELTVSVSTGDDFLSGPLYVGLDIATVGSDTDFWLDRADATAEKFSPAFGNRPPAVMWAAGGPLQSGWSRRNGSALSFLVSEGIDGVRDTTTSISYTPTFTTAFGISAPNVVAAYFNPRTAGTNNWSTANLRKVVTWEVSSTKLVLRAGGATTWSVITPRADILWVVEPAGGETPWA